MKAVRSPAHATTAPVALMPGEPVELRLLVPAGAAWLSAAIVLSMSATSGLVAAAALVIVGAAIAATISASETSSGASTFIETCAVRSRVWSSIPIARRP